MERGVPEEGVPPPSGAQAELSWADLSERLIARGMWLVPTTEFSDGTKLINHHVYVCGLGPGIVLEFHKQALGASAHIVRFHKDPVYKRASPIQERIKLQRKDNAELPWLLGRHLYSALAHNYDDSGMEPEPEPEPRPETGPEAGLQPVTEPEPEPLVETKLPDLGVPHEIEPLPEVQERIEALKRQPVMIRSNSEIQRQSSESPRSKTLDDLQLRRDLQVIMEGEGDKLDMWVDGASLEDTPRHMLVGTIVLVEGHGIGIVIEFTRVSLGDKILTLRAGRSLHTVDFKYPHVRQQVRAYKHQLM